MTKGAILLYLSLLTYMEHSGSQFSNNIRQYCYHMMLGVSKMMHFIKTTKIRVFLISIFFKISA